MEFIKPMKRPFFILKKIFFFISLFPALIALLSIHLLTHGSPNDEHYTLLIYVSSASLISLFLPVFYFCIFIRSDRYKALIPGLVNAGVLFFAAFIFPIISIIIMLFSSLPDASQSMQQAKKEFEEYKQDYTQAAKLISTNMLELKKDSEATYILGKYELPDRLKYLSKDGYVYLYENFQCGKYIYFPLLSYSWGGISYGSECTAEPTSEFFIAKGWRLEQEHKATGFIERYDIDD